jgi:hypothetical protein
MRDVTPLDLARIATVAVLALGFSAPAGAQYRSLPVQPALPPPPPSPAPMSPPRPPAEFGAPPVPPVQDGTARQTERVCIENEMSVDVPVSPNASERK